MMRDFNRLDVWLISRELNKLIYATKDLDYLSNNKFKRLIEGLDRLGKKLNPFIQYIEKVEIK